MQSSDVQDRGRPLHRSPLLLAAVIIAGALTLVGIESVVALAIVMMEGLIALGVMAGAALAGGWVLRGLRDGPTHARIILGAGLGIGALSLATFGLGVAGALNSTAALALVLTLAALGVVRLVLDLRRLTPRSVEIAGRHWVWLASVPFLTITLLGTALPPGVLWAEEARGYDVLEYHLAVPREFYEAGRVGFLPHNVYSNFPLASEMLSLLMMTLRQDPIEASFMATTANVALAVVFVAAAWLAGTQFSPTAGLATGVLAAVTPWVAYLASIAYVEPGMLAMGMCALAALLIAWRTGRLDLRWVTVAGVLAGLSCGFKYTAVPLIALPLGLLVVARPRSAAETGDGVPGARPHDLKRIALALGVYGLASLAAFSPWLIRNIVNTGNPVFPLAYSVFGAKEGTWDDELQARWKRAHASADAEQDERPMVVRAIDRTVRDPRFGWLLIPLAILSAVRHRDRAVTLLLAILAVQTVIWLVATHLFARFAVVFLLPLLPLAGRAFEPASRHAPDSEDAAADGARRRDLLMAGVLGLAALLHVYPLAELYYHDTRVAGEVDGQIVVRPIEAYGHTDWFVTGQWPGFQYLSAIHELHAGGKSPVRVLLVGEARTFYLQAPAVYATVFNRHPLADAVRRNPDPEAILAWLQGGGGEPPVTHVLVHWLEMERLGATYGFYEELTPGLFQRLQSAGLEPAGTFSLHEGGSPYATLYRVPQP